MIVPNEPRIAVIGAGLSGLVCAYTLRQKGNLNVTIFEKSRVLGGRCATKSWADCSVDTGVQYFNIRSTRFSDLITQFAVADQLEKLPANSIITRTTRPHSHGTARGDGHGMFYFRSGNNSLAVALAEDLDVRHHATVTKIDTDGNVIFNTRIPGTTQTEEHAQQFDLIICSSPLPQTSIILGSHSEWSDSYYPNLTALLKYDVTQLPQTSLVKSALESSTPYAVIDDTKHGPFWAACENVKRGRVISPGAAVLVVQSSHEFSQRYVDAAPEQWLPQLRSFAERVWQIPESCITDSFAKRWRYSRVAQAGVGSGQIGERVVVIGDGVAGESDVECVALNGLDTADAILKKYGPG